MKLYDLTTVKLMCFIVLSRAFVCVQCALAASDVRSKIT